MKRKYLFDSHRYLLNFSKCTLHFYECTLYSVKVMCTVVTVQWNNTPCCFAYMSLQQCTKYKFCMLNPVFTFFPVLTVRLLLNTALLFILDSFYALCLQCPKLVYSTSVNSRQAHPQTLSAPSLYTTYTVTAE